MNKQFRKDVDEAAKAAGWRPMETHKYNGWVFWGKNLVEIRIVDNRDVQLAITAAYAAAGVLLDVKEDRCQ